MKRNSILTGILAVCVFLNASATIINVPDDYETIQGGIDASSDGDTVLVHPGTYVENINFNAHNIVLGSLFLTTGDTTYIAETIIDGDSSGSVVTFESGEDSTANITGLTIQNGYAEFGGGIYCYNNVNCAITYNIISGNTVARFLGGGGGGIFCGSSSNPTIRKNIISLNKAEGNFYPGRGGGIHCLESAPMVVENMIWNNRAGSGGAIYCLRSPIIISDNLIIENHSGYIGGGIYCGEADPIIRGNTIMGNSVTGYQYSSGGGIYLGDSNPFIESNIVIANSADSMGGGIICIRSSPLIINSVLYGNVSSTGGGIFGRTSSYPEVANCIFWADSAIVGSELEFDDSSGPLITYSNIEGGWEGEGNIDVDPLFRDPENGDFHLMSIACGDPFDSPCIDAGSPAILDSLLDCSWGLGAIRGDMGAYGGGDSVTVGIDGQDRQVPNRFTLAQNYPNPFNATTVIRYALPEAADVRIEIYDILGRRVETLVLAEQQAGYQQVVWNANDKSSGIYFYRIQAGEYAETKKMVLLK